MAGGLDESVPSLWNRGVQALNRAQQRRSLSDVEIASVSFTAVLGAIPEDDRNRSGVVANLSGVYRLRFEITGELGDLSRAVDFARVAAEAPAPSLSAHLGRALHLAAVLDMRYGAAGAVEDLNDAIAAQATFNAVPPDVVGADMARQVFVLASLFGKRFVHRADPADLDAMIALAELALSSTRRDDPLLAPIVHDLTLAYTRRFAGDATTATRNPSDLRRAAEVAAIGAASATLDLDDRTALAQEMTRILTVAGSYADTDEDDYFEAGRISGGFLRESAGDLEARLQATHQLAGLHLLHYERRGSVPDLDAAVKYAQECVDGYRNDPQRRADAESVLSTIRCRQFERTSDARYLDEAVQLSEAVLRRGASDPGLRLSAANYTNAFLAFMTRFERDGADVDLDQALSAACHALDIAADDDPAISRYLMNAGIAYRNRYGRFRAEADYDKALEFVLRGLQRTPAEHPDRPHNLHVLATVRWVHFEAIGTRSDLTAALQAGQAAADAATPGSSWTAMHLAWFGAAHLSLYERRGQSSDLDRSIDLLESAVAASRAEDRQLVNYLNLLAIACQSRHAERHEDADLASAIRFSEQAVDLSRTAAPVKAAQLRSNLATTYLSRHNSQSRRADDLTTAFRILDDLLAELPANDLRRQAVLLNHGSCATQLLSGTGDSRYRDVAAGSYRSVAEENLYAPQNRVLASRRLGKLLRDTAPEEAADSFRQAVSILAAEVHGTDLEQCHLAKVDHGPVVMRRGPAVRHWRV